MSIRRRAHTPAMEQRALGFPPSRDSEQPPSGPTPISAVMSHSAQSVDAAASVEALASYLIEHRVSAWP